MQKALTCLATLCIALSASATELVKPASPATQPVSPGLKQYMGRTIAQTMHFAGAPWLVRESREREEEPAKLMKALKLKKGMTVADLGCGNGFYSIKIAQAIGPEGKVLAVDIQKQMLELLKKRAEKAGVANIQPILGNQADPMLPEAKVDLALLVDVYHELDHPVEILAAVRKSLAPAGRMVLVEFRAEDPKVPIKPVHKMTRAQIENEITANGFKVVDHYNDMPWQHVVFFEIDPSPYRTPHSHKP